MNNNAKFSRIFELSFILGAKITGYCPPVGYEYIYENGGPLRPKVPFTEEEQKIIVQEFLGLCAYSPIGYFEWLKKNQEFAKTISSYIKKNLRPRILFGGVEVYNDLGEKTAFLKFYSPELSNPLALQGAFFKVRYILEKDGGECLQNWDIILSCGDSLSKMLKIVWKKVKNKKIIVNSDYYLVGKKWEKSKFPYFPPLKS